MSRDAQFEILLQVLKRFQEAGVLSDLMLIGSWCLQFYRYHFEHPEKLPAFRTLDVDFLILIHYKELRVRTPEPAVFALHKLIVSSRRVNKEKQKADLETAVGLLDFLYSRPNEVARIRSLLSSIPKNWLKAILSVSEKHFPRLNETLG